MQADTVKSFTIKSFRGGISDWEDKGIRGSFKHGQALSIRRRRDSIYSNQALITADNETPVVVDLIKYTVPASDGNTYLFGASKIYKQTSAGVVSVVYTDSDGQICGAEEMWCSNGKKYLFWATSTKLKCKEIPGTNWTTDVNANVVVGATTYTYPKTNLGAATNHTMKVANGALMICNGNYLAMVGWDGSYTNEAVRFLPDMKAKTLIDRDDYVVVGTETYSGRKRAHLFEWETNSLNYTKKQKLPVASINALIDGEVMLMQGGTSGQIFYSDFLNKLPVTTFPAGGQVNPGAIIEDDGIVYFGVYGSTDATKDGIYSYGRNQKNGDFALNFEYPITCTEIGALEVIGGVLHVSYRVTTSYYWYKVNTAAKQIGVYESLDLTAPTKGSATDTSWETLDIFLSALPSGASVGVKYRVNKASAWISAQLDGDTTLLSVADAVKATFLIGAVGDVIEVQVTITPTSNTSPEIHRFNLYFN